MVWQEKILSRISEDSTRPQIIVDETHILLQPQFCNHLKCKNIKYHVCSTTREIISTEKEQYSLIICPVVDIPLYLGKKYEIIHFTWRMLPINCESELYNKITTSQYILLLDYSSEHGIDLYINRLNVSDFLRDAELCQMKKNKIEIENKLKTFIEEELTIEKLCKCGKVWGDYLFVCYSLNENPDSDLQFEIDRNVYEFILKGELKNIFYYPARQNITVDKVLPYLKSLKLKKTALLCFDGMGWAEWKILENYLREKGFSFNSSPQCALIPTITIISRTALFTGVYEKGFRKKKNEKKSFEEYWSENKEKKACYSVNKHLTKEQLIGINYVGVIYSFFDKIAHGMEFPKNSRSKNLYFDAIKNYLLNAKIENDFQVFLEEGFKIFLCSDHGTVLAKGNGKRIDKYLIDKSSRRATVIHESILNKFINELKYDIPFIDNKIVVIAGNREVFSSKNKLVLSHGGITLEELIIPFVEVIQ